MMSSPTLSPPNARKLLETSQGLQAPNDIRDVQDVLDDNSEADGDGDRLLKALAFLQLIGKLNEDIEASITDINHLASTIGREYLSKLRPQDLLPGKPELHYLQCISLTSTQESKENIQVASTAEVALACLHALVSNHNCSLDEETLYHITAYTGPEDPWTTEEAALIASGLIDTCLDEDQIRHYIVDDVLPRRIRPFFSGTTSKVGHSGRPSRFPDQAPRTAQPFDTAPWKKGGLQIISAVRWVVHNTDVDLIRDHWPLFTPVLLTISDDQDTSIRRLGLEITTDFLKKCPVKVLQSTGIGDVFEDTILPSVLYLPNLTPAEESVKIMGAAYEALLVLVEKEVDIKNPTRRALLDRIFRNGVFAAYDHASNYPTVVESLMSTTAALLDKFGIFAVKHLPKLLSMISSVLTDPFVGLHLGLAVQATLALNAVISNCWPRIVQGGYDGEITRVITICWLNVTDGTSAVNSANPDVEHLERLFKQTQAMLRSLRENSGVPEPEATQKVVKKEPRLSKILSPT